MTTATASTTSPAGPLVLADPAGTVRLARWTGAAYLALGVTGVVGILALAPQLTAADPAATLAALRANDALARAVIAMELGVVISQALAAVWFWRLFSALGRTADGVAVLAFGLVNAVAILGSVAARAVALAVAADPALAPGADAAAAVALAQEASTQLWAVGA
ncbi:MAG TPA: DUF4386 family protein, partial [Actinotalea sp.]|nr:DUF4386 family protein [Actinotalea sp.]